MPTITLRPDQRFPAGTVLYAFPATQGGRPKAAAVASATVASDSTTTFDDADLIPGQTYVAGTTANGPFITFQVDVASTVPGAAGVEYVDTDSDLPATAEGHPVVLVLADASAGGQASLRYWTGTEWQILGLAGGGTVESDFIEVEFAGSIAIGQTIAWDAGDERFEPAGLA